MSIYGYDGTLEGFLSVLDRVFADAADSRATADEVAVAGAENFTPDLFDRPIEVSADPAAARRFAGVFADTAGRMELHLVLYCRASERAGVETLIARYVQRVARTGGSIRHDLADPLVRDLNRIHRKVRAEIHRYQGILRFRKLEDGLYYAPIEPDADLLPFLGPRIAARFRDQPFCIHDRKRETVYWHAHRRPELGDRPAEAEEELQVQALWQHYFDGITIRERHNPRLQRTKLPERYWKYLPEMTCEFDRNGTKEQEHDNINNRQPYNK